MKYRAHNKKRDANEPAIVAALEAIPGCIVTRLDQPVDLLIGFDGETHLLEVKNPAGKNRLTDAQLTFIDLWTGAEVHIVHDADEALAAIGFRLAVT